MVHSTTIDPVLKELAYRLNDGIEVSLLWDTRTNHLIVRVGDQKAGDSFRFVVESDRALDAFEHPYAYAAARGVHYRTGVHEAAYA